MNQLTLIECSIYGYRGKRKLKKKIKSLKWQIREGILTSRVIAIRGASLRVAFEINI